MPRKWVSSSSYRNAIREIVDARNKAGLSQRDVASALKKSPSWIAKVEGMERRLDFIEFIALARALGLNEMDLLKEVVSVLPRRLDI